MVWYNAEALEIGGIVVEGKEELIPEYNILRSVILPEGYTSYIFPLRSLDPITKIQEETFYAFVKDSIDHHGMLYHPLVVHPIHTSDWKEELILDKNQTPPDLSQDEERLRIQCGCNRFFAAKELGFTAIECIIAVEKEEAQNLCHTLRVDKRWQRGDNMTRRIEENKRNNIS